MSHTVITDHPYLRFPKGKTLETIKSVLRGERQKKLRVSVIFTNAKSIRTLNKAFLRHDYSTDVLAFPLDSEGEVYINLDKARIQAREYGVTYVAETKRLLIHGMLHLIGYTDKTKTQKKTMTIRENLYLSRLGVD